MLSIDSSKIYKLYYSLSSLPSLKHFISQNWPIGIGINLLYRRESEVQQDHIKYSKTHSQYKQKSSSKTGNYIHSLTHLFIIVLTSFPTIFLLNPYTLSPWATCCPLNLRDIYLPQDLCFFSSLCLKHSLLSLNSLLQSLISYHLLSETFHDHIIKNVLLAPPQNTLSSFCLPYSSKVEV